MYSWGYGCNGNPTGFAPSAMSGGFCSSMQIPGPTLIVTEGDPVSVTLTNNLPTPAGSTSILFPGFNVSTTGGVAGIAHAGGCSGRFGDVHVHSIFAGHARLLQRNARRPAGRNGALWGDHRPARRTLPQHVSGRARDKRGSPRALARVRLPVSACGV